MNVLYDENGDFKLGTILGEHDGSLQVESQHGKRSKVKTSHVLMRFGEPSVHELIPAAEGLKDEMDPSFLWEACGDEEFSFADLAREYFGGTPTAPQSTAVLLKLHEAPVYFHRKGRGRYRRAPVEILRAALASLERKRQQQMLVAEWVAELKAFRLPDALRPHISMLLYKPDRNRPEAKAFEEACAETGLSAARLLEKCGMLPSSHDYHFGRFLYEFFPEGAALPEVEFAVPENLPVAEVAAFSLDDADTTEIDDAFSVGPGDGGHVRIGIHIAAPALGFGVDDKAGAVARHRLSTVYAPGRKLTMLPGSVIAAFTLAAGKARPALSLYVDVDPATQTIAQTYSIIEAVPVAANLRHQQIEAINPVLQQGGDVSSFPYGSELRTLYRFAVALATRRGDDGRGFERPEYIFRVEGERVEISERQRGAPLDKLVAELMILANSSWGRLLADQEVPAIYRAQSQGKVRITTVPAPHEGIGVSHYAWSSSPLRRYVDLVNQWQLAALLNGTPPPFQRNSASLLGAIRDFELSYAAYAEFQDRMERYWCLRWLIQEGIKQTPATVVRESTVKIRDIPLYVRVPSLPPELGPGTQVIVEVDAVDLIDSTIDAIYKTRQGDSAGG
jgi:exoribonuclease-2